MPKQSAYVAHDAEAGTAKVFHRLHDGGWVYQSLQDCQAIADANAEARNHLSAWTPSRDIKQHSRVPVIYIEKFLREYGLNVYSADQEEQRRINRLIETEYPWMMVSTGSES